MDLKDHYAGANAPFRGDRTLVLHGLPAGARVTAASLALTPLKAPPQTPPSGVDSFVETFSFGQLGSSSSSSSSGTGTAQGWPALQADAWGVTKLPASPSNFVEVDFHTRCTLYAVEGLARASSSSSSAGTPAVGLQISLGGVFVDIDQHGTIHVPNGPPYDVQASGGTLPGLVTDRFQLTAPGVTIAGVSVVSVPTNLSVRLGTQKPFWTLTGETAAPATSDDFSAALGAFLATATPQNGYFEIPFVIHSDSIARIDVDVDLTYVLSKLVLPPHLPQATLPFDYGSRPSSPATPTTITLPRDAMPVQGATSVRVQGRFDSTRVAQRSIGEDPAMTWPVAVSPASTLAQFFAAQSNLALSGVDLNLGTTDPQAAGLDVAIRPDEGGKPSQAVLASAPLGVQKPLPGESGWRNSSFPAPVRLEQGKQYWIVLQSLISNANWSASAEVGTGEPALQRSQDGGASWRIATTQATIEPLAALFRLRHKPEQFSIPIQLQVGSGKGAERRALGEYASLGRIDFSFDFAQTLDTYLKSQAATARCRPGERIDNGRFDSPSSADATRRLFGDDTGLGVYAAGKGTTQVESVDLSHGVDLSRQRFITLGVAGDVPIRIDCSGSDAAHTTAADIAAAINAAVRATGRMVASEVNGKVAIEGLGQLILYLGCRPVTPDGWLAPAGQVSLVTWPDGSERTVAALATSSLLGNQMVLPAQGPDGRYSPRLVWLGCAARGFTPTEVDTGEDATLSQQVPVTAGCAYHLQVIFGRADAYQPQTLVGGSTGILTVGSTGARWEVEWLDSAGSSVSVDTGTLATAPVPQLFTAGRSATVNTTQPLFWHAIDSILTAPGQSARAEIRIVHPDSAEYALLVAEVSFGVDSQALANTSFQVWTQTDRVWTPAGWTVSGGTAVQLQNGGVCLKGDGVDDTVLGQVAPVEAGAVYEVCVSGGPVTPPSTDPSTLPMDQRPRLELSWQGGPPGSAVNVPLDTPGFATKVWQGTAPAGATAIKVRVIQPRGSADLLVDDASLIRSEPIEVPLTFLSEAPGQLTISNFAASYDLPAPPTALSPPSLPSVQAAGSPLAAVARPTSSSSAATRSTTASSAAVVARVAPAAPSSSSAAAVRVNGPPAAPTERQRGSETELRATDMARAGAQPTAADRALTEVPTIGERRAGHLAAAGITSVAQLARARPQQVMGALGPMSQSRAEALIAEAKRLLEEGGR